MMTIQPISMLPDDAADLLPEQFERVLELVASIAKTIHAKQPPKYLTVQDAAIYCRCAVQTLYNHRRHIERMPGVRKLLFTREALDKWLTTRRGSRRKQK